MKKKQRLIRRSALISPSPLTLLYIADEGDFFITQILPFFVSFRNFLCSQSKHLVKYTKRSIQDLQTKEEYPMAFADKLRALRHINNMTQDHLAQQMNLARTTIAGYESKNRQPSHENLFAFARFFHVSVDYLISDGEPVPYVLKMICSITFAFWKSRRELTIRILRLYSPKHRKHCRLSGSRQSAFLRIVCQDSERPSISKIFSTDFSFIASLNIFYLIPKYFHCHIFFY